MPYITSNKDRRRLGLHRVSNSNSLVKCLPIPENIYNKFKKLLPNYSENRTTLYKLIEETIDNYYTFEYNLEFFTDIKEVPYGKRNINTDNQ